MKNHILLPAADDKIPPESGSFYDYLSQKGIGSVSVMVDICIVFAVIALLGVIFTSVYLTTDISDKSRCRAKLVRRLFLVLGAAPLVAFGAAYTSMCGWIEIEPPTLFFVVLNTVLIVMIVRLIWKLIRKK